MERSEWVAIGIIAIIKSGGAYVPIDIDFPVQRKTFIKEDANLKLVFDNEELNNFIKSNNNIFQKI